MKLGGDVTDQELEAVVERGRRIRRAPDVVRARLLARARAHVAAARASSIPTATPWAGSTWRGRRIAVAAAALLAFTTAGAAAALYSRATRPPEIVPLPTPSPKVPAVRAAAPEPLAAEPTPQLVPTSRPQHPHRLLSPQESYAAELYLLQQAQSDYAGQDFLDALVLVAEHARRFPKGRLAEEREALRVRSLAGAGRGDEASRALVAFARRFPRSVLLPRLREQARAAAE